MALRYSGDVEVRIAWNPRALAYDARVRDLASPSFHWRGSIPKAFGSEGAPRSSLSYDRAAKVAIALASGAAQKRRIRLAVEEGVRGQVLVRRIFQAPCPIESSRATRRRGGV